MNAQAIPQRFLRAPLIGKLLGANLLIALAALGASALWAPGGRVWFVWIALGISFALNTFLVRLALSPLDALQRVAEGVSNGEWYMRSTLSPIADRRIGRLGDTFNRLLDRAQSDRAHIHELIQRSLGVRENERAELAHELREATAQQLAALQLQLATVERGFGGPEGLTALAASRALSTQLVNDVRRVADSVYPGLLHELGLSAALVALGTRMAKRTTLRVAVDASHVGEHLAPAVVTALYHVAVEASQNAERHANARSLWVTLKARDGMMRLEILDDGKGFVATAETLEENGVGLFEARELLAHVHGELHVSSAPGRGTYVLATARLDQGGTS